MPPCRIVSSKGPCRYLAGGESGLCPRHQRTAAASASGARARFRQALDDRKPVTPLAYTREHDDTEIRGSRVEISEEVAEGFDPAEVTFSEGDRLRAKAAVAATATERDELLAAARLADRARAANTRRAYIGGWGIVRAWAAEAGVPPLGMGTDGVLRFLGHLELRGRLDPATGEPTGDPLTYNYVSRFVHLISEAHRQFDLPDPTADPQITAVLAGWANEHGRTGKGKDALTLDDLVTIIDHALALDLVAYRTRAALLLHAALDGGVPWDALADLTWEGVAWATGDTAVLLTVGGRQWQIAVGAHPDTDPVQALRALWRQQDEPAAGPVMGCAGNTLSRAAGDALAATGGVLAAAAEGLLAPSPAAVRDAAMWALQWWGFRRGSEVRELVVSQVDMEDDRGVRIRPPKSKTNQDGKRRELYGAVAKSGSVSCPVTRLTAWLERLAALHGCDVAELPDDAPLFTTLGRDADAPVLDSTITYEATRKALKAAAHAAGVTGDLGTHSLRSGPITAAIEAENPPHPTVLQAQTGQVDPASLSIYYRRSESIGRTNPGNAIVTSDPLNDPVPDPVPDPEIVGTEAQKHD